MKARHADLQQRRAAVSRARSEIAQAVGRMLPTVELRAGANYSLIQPTIDASSEGPNITHMLLERRNLLPSVGLSARVGVSLAAWSRWKAAGAGLEAAQATLQATNHALFAELADAVFAVVTAQRIAALSSSELTAAKARHELTVKGLHLGQATALDVARFAQDVRAMERQQVDSTVALSQAQTALGAALGVERPVAVDPKMNYRQVLESPTESGCVLRGPDQPHPQVAAAELQLRQAEFNADVAHHTYFPEFRLTTQYSGSYAATPLQSLSAIGGERRLLHTWSASVELVWVAFDLGMSGQVQAAEAERAQAQAAKHSAQSAITLARHDAQATLDAAKRSAHIAQQAKEDARVLESLSERAFELGQTTALERLDAIQHLRTSQLDVLVHDLELLQAQLQAQLLRSACN